MKTKMEALMAVASDRCELVIRADELLGATHRIVGEANDPTSAIDPATLTALARARDGVLADAIEAVLMLHTARREIAREAEAEGRMADGPREVLCKHRGSKRDETAEAWVCDACGAVLKDGGKGWVRP